MSTPEDAKHSALEGLDASWLAVDGDGHLAWLLSNGSGAVPDWMERQARADTETGSDGLPFVDDLVERLTPHCEASDGPPELAHPLWRATAQRGLVVFDWECHRRQYVRVATPHVPLHLEAAPAAMARVAALTRLAHLCFLEAAALTHEDIARSTPSEAARST